MAWTTQENPLRRRRFIPAFTRHPLHTVSTPHFESYPSQVELYETSAPQHISSTPQLGRYPSHFEPHTAFTLESESQPSQFELHTTSTSQASQYQFSLIGQLRAIFWSISTWVALVLSTTGFALYYCGQSDIAVFFVNFLAIIPSAIVLAFGVDELTLRFGDIIGGLVGFTFGNAVQLISSILLLKNRQVALLQNSLLGSILANLLLMTGLSFFIGGLRRIEQYFHAQVARTIGMFLLLAVLSLVIPTTAHIIAGTSPAGIQAQSRATSVIIMTSYGLWLLFQLKTNTQLFGVSMRDRQPPNKAITRSASKKTLAQGAVSRGVATIGAGMAAVPEDLAETRTGVFKGQVFKDQLKEDEAQPQLSFISAVTVTLVSTALIGFNTEFTTNSVNAMLEQAGLPEGFVGLIILPLLSVDPLSIKPAILDKMDVSLSLTLERCMQTSLFVIPFIVLLAWCMDIGDMTLEFSAFTVTALFASIVIVTYVVQEGKSNWLTGVLLIKVYIIIAVSSFYVPQKLHDSLSSAT